MSDFFLLTLWHVSVYKETTKDKLSWFFRSLLIRIYFCYFRNHLKIKHFLLLLFSKTICQFYTLSDPLKTPTSNNPSISVFDIANLSSINQQVSTIKSRILITLVIFFFECLQNWLWRAKTKYSVLYERVRENFSIKYFHANDINAYAEVGTKKLNWISIYSFEWQ